MVSRSLASLPVPPRRWYYQGTIANDTFTVTGLTGPTRGQIALAQAITVQTSVNVTKLTLNGNSDVDTFNVTALVARPLSFTNGIALNGDAVANLAGNSVVAPQPSRSV